MKRAAPDVTVTWTPECDDRRLRRVMEILLEIMRNPMDSETAPAKHRTR